MHPLSIAQVVSLMMLATPSAPPHAAPPSRSLFPPYLTTEMLIAEYRGTPHPAVPGAGSAYTSAHAAGYVAAVADLGQGSSWCLPFAMTPSEADSIVVAALAHAQTRTSGQSSMPTYAGALLLAQYAVHFPAKQGCKARPRLSASAFLIQLSGIGRRLHSDGSIVSPQTIDSQRYAEGYSAGVIDVTQGRSWCAPRGLKPMEVESRMLSELDRRHADEKLSGNAGALLLEIYESLFPCQSTRVPR